MSTGTSVGAPGISAPAGERSNEISLRNAHLSFHQACALWAKPSRPTSNDRTRAVGLAERIGARSFKGKGYERARARAPGIIRRRCDAFVAVVAVVIQRLPRRATRIRFPRRPC